MSPQVAVGRDAMVPAPLNIPSSKVVPLPRLAPGVGPLSIVPVAEEVAGQVKCNKSVVLLALQPYQGFYLTHPSPEHFVINISLSCALTHLPALLTMKCPNEK